LSVSVIEAVNVYVNINVTITLNIIVNMIVFHCLTCLSLVEEEATIFCQSVICAWSSIRDEELVLLQISSSTGIICKYNIKLYLNYLRIRQV
jgi:hypothetical protein